MLENSSGATDKIIENDNSSGTLKFYGKDTFKDELITGIGGILLGILLQFSAAITGPVANVTGVIILILAAIRVIKAKSNSQKRFLKPLLEINDESLLLNIPGINKKEILINQIKEIEIKKFLAGTRIKLIVEGNKNPIMFLNTIFDKSQREQILSYFENLKNLYK